MTTDRALGFGAEGRIPSRSIRQFAQDHGLADPDDYAWFLGVMREMDSEYLGMRVPRPAGPVGETVSMTDAKGITALLRRLAKKPGPTTAA